ncbi:SRPBCC family protein [Rubritalea tangerina]|uniref:SRPBCC family protein n=2 Tax=Rubritalea tangerina TaxID=430798 RepID=A0ABW4Z7B1_9BACT
MQIQTSTQIKASPDSIWPLLTESRMDVPGCFCLGVPQPRSCELPDQVGGVGAERRCISDRGVVVQRITEWSPPKKLSFEMVSTDHSWSSCVDSIKEEFILSPSDTGTRVTRRTTLKANGTLAKLKEFGFYAGLKRVHFYVFKNWRSSVEHDA